MTAQTAALARDLRDMLEGAAPAAAPAADDVTRAMGSLSESLASAQRELAGHHKKLTGMLRGPRGEDLRAVLLIVKEAHGILGDLRQTVRDEFKV